MLKKIFKGITLMILGFIFTTQISNEKAYAYTMPHNLTTVKYAGWTEQMKADFTTHPYYLIYQYASGYQIIMYNKPITMVARVYNNSSNSGLLHWQADYDGIFTTKIWYKPISGSWTQREKSVYTYEGKSGSGVDGAPTYASQIVFDDVVHGSNVTWDLEKTVNYQGSPLGTSNYKIDGPYDFVTRIFPYTLDENGESNAYDIISPSSYSSDGTINTHPYYVVSKGTGASSGKVFFNVSSEPFYIDGDGYLHRADAYYYVSSDRGKTWNTKVRYGTNTRLSIKQDDVLFNNNDIYRTNILNPSTNTDYNKVKNGKTSELVIPKNPLSDVTPVPYSYEYSSSIPNISNLKMQKYYLYKLGNVYIGLDKTKYEVSWDAPLDSQLKLEVKVKGTYNNITRAFWAQTYKQPMYLSTNTYVLPKDGRYTVSLPSTAKELTEKAFADINVQVKNQDDYVTPSDIYYRYVSVNPTDKKVYYGNWTRVKISKLGASGITDIKIDYVTQNETVDPETGETIYTDVPIPENETKYYDPQTGEEISEEQTFNAVSDSMVNALDSATNAFKSVGQWVGQVPGLVGALFETLPSDINQLIALGISLVVILRIVGR